MFNSAWALDPDYPQCKVSLVSVLSVQNICLCCTSTFVGVLSHIEHNYSQVCVRYNSQLLVSGFAGIYIVGTLQDTKMADAAPAAPAKPADQPMQDGEVRSNGPSEVCYQLQPRCKHPPA